MILTVTNQKGGAGKTTVVECLAMAWHSEGYRTLVVDADEQATAHDWAAIAASQELDVPEVIRLTDWRLICRQLPAQAEAYDCVIIDTPPRLGKISSAAMGISDMVILPVCPGGHDHNALGPTLDLIEDVQVRVPDIQVAILLNKIANTRIARDHRPAIQELTDLKILSSELRMHTSYIEAQTAGETPLTYEPRGAAAKEIRAVVSEIDSFAEGVDAA